MNYQFLSRQCINNSSMAVPELKTAIVDDSVGAGVYNLSNYCDDFWSSEW